VPPPPLSTLFPYTTLFRSGGRADQRLSSRDRIILSQRMPLELLVKQKPLDVRSVDEPDAEHVPDLALEPIGDRPERRGRAQDGRDRKSTRLNSSHDQISYA